MKRLVERMAAFGFAAVFLWVAPVQAQIFVDCDAGDSIQNALNAQVGTPRAEVEFVGTCDEFITISHDRALIEGDENGGSVLIGQIRIFGPSNVTLRDFTVSGEGNGLLAWGGRTRVFGVDFTDNVFSGVVGNDGAVIRLSGCWIGNNLGGPGIVLSDSSVRLSNSHVVGHSDLGILARDGSRVLAFGGSISDNHRGVFAANGSAVRVTDTHVTDNVIDGFLLANNSSAELVGAVITRNGGHGVDAGMNSSIDISEGFITDNGESGVHITDHSFVRLTGTEVSGNVMSGITLINDSGVGVGDFTNVPNNLSGWAIYCEDLEATLDISDLASVGRKRCFGWRFRNR